MTKITGTIQGLEQTERKILRIRHMVPWIEQGKEFLYFDIVNGRVNFEIPATSKENPYLVDYINLDQKEIVFAPVESWIIPIEDCDISQVRNLSISYVDFLKAENEFLKIRNKVLEDSHQSAELINILRQEKELIEKKFDVVERREKAASAHLTTLLDDFCKASEKITELESTIEKLKKEILEVRQENKNQNINSKKTIAPFLR